MNNLILFASVSLMFCLGSIQVSAKVVEVATTQDLKIELINKTKKDQGVVKPKSCLRITNKADGARAFKCTVLAQKVLANGGDGEQYQRVVGFHVYPHSSTCSNWQTEKWLKIIELKQVHVAHK